MAVFRYVAYTDAGDLSRGDIEAASADHALDALLARGLTPVETAALAPGVANAPWWRRELFARHEAKPAELAAFTSELAMLAQADIAIDDAMGLLVEQGTSPTICRLASQLLAKLLDGSTLSDAVAGYPRSFSSDYVNIVRAGEASGEVGRVLSELADLLERRLELKNKLRSAMVYPAILVVVAGVSTAIILSVLVPSIAPIFAEANRPLPGGLQAIIDIEANWPLVCAGIAAIAAAIWLAIGLATSRPAFVQWLDRLKLRAPIFGAQAGKRDTARFARTLGTLLRARVPLLQSLASAGSVIANKHIRSGVERSIEAVRDGERLDQALARVDGLPTYALRMISVGEEAGKVDQMLLRVAQLFERQLQQQIDRLMGLLAPALTIAIAGVIGALIFTVMSAILSINELASQ